MITVSDFDEDHGPGPGELSADQAHCAIDGHVERDGWCTRCGLLLDVLSSICRACAGGSHHLHSRFSGGFCISCACPVLLPYGFEPSIGADL